MRMRRPAAMAAMSAFRMSPETTLRLGNFCARRCRLAMRDESIPTVLIVARERRRRMRRNADGARDLLAPVEVLQEVLAEALASHGGNSVARGATRDPAKRGRTGATLVVTMSRAISLC